MAVTTHHIHNVLRAYGKQLSVDKSVPKKAGVTRRGRPDPVTISAQSRRKTVIEKVTSDIVHRIIHDGFLGDQPRKRSRLGKDESVNRRPAKDNGAELVFKVIDKNKGEVTRTISMEDSEFLKDELREANNKKDS